MTKEIQTELKLHISNGKKSETELLYERIADLERALSVMRRAHFAFVGTQNENNRIFEKRMINLELAQRYKPEGSSLELLESSL